MRSKRNAHGQLNNAGFSLIELVVVVLLGAVVALMVAGFIEASRSTYQKVDEDSQLQTEAQAASALMREVAGTAMDAGWSIGGSSSNGAAGYDITGGLNSNKGVIWFEGYDYENPASDAHRIYVFALDDTEVMRYAVYNKSDITTGANLVTRINTDLLDYSTNARYALLAEYMTSFAVSKQSGGDGTLFSITLDFEYRGHVYDTTLKVLARNMK